MDAADEEQTKSQEGGGEDRWSDARRQQENKTKLTVPAKQKSEERRWQPRW